MLKQSGGRGKYGHCKVKFGFQWMLTVRRHPNVGGYIRRWSFSERYIPKIGEGGIEEAYAVRSP